MPVPQITIDSVAGDTSPTPTVSPPGGWPVQGQVTIFGVGVTLISMTYQLGDGDEKDIVPCPVAPPGIATPYLFLIPASDITTNGIVTLKVRAYDSTGGPPGFTPKNLNCINFPPPPPTPVPLI
jgi:hypothetical protein